MIGRCIAAQLSTSLDVTANHGDDIEEMLIMNNEVALRAEIEYRRQRLLQEAAAERIAKEIREAASARTG